MGIWHQGTVYEATAYAVPFLIRLAAAAGQPDRELILVYLCHLALGSSYLDVHQHMSIMAEMRSEPDFAEKLARELGWVRAAREAVRLGGPVYAGLLHDAAPEVRAAAAHLLGHFHEDAARNAGWIRAAAERETDETARAAFVQSLDFLAGADRETVLWLEAVLAEDASHAVRIAAAIALAQARGPDCPAAALPLLIEAAIAPGPVKAVYEAFPWEDADVQLHAGHALARLGAEATQTVLPALIRAMEDVTPAQSWSVARAMLQLVFAGKPMPAGLAASALSAAQRESVTAIAESETFWRESAQGCIVINVVEVLEDFGLPENRPELRAFVGLAPLPPDAPQEDQRVLRLKVRR